MHLLDVAESGGDEHAAIRKPIQEGGRARLLVALQARRDLLIGFRDALEDEVAALDVRQAWRSGVRRRDGANREGGRESGKPDE